MCPKTLATNRSKFLHPKEPRALICLAAETDLQRGEVRLSVTANYVPAFPNRPTSTSSATGV
jgi:hypothetical protein